MKKLGLLPIGLMMVLSGCAKAPDNTQAQDNKAVEDEQPHAQDANQPDSYGVVKICGDGTKVYLLSGGAANGQYAIWQDQWELLAPGVSPESVCSN